MDKKTFLVGLCAGLLAALILPSDVMASTGKAFDIQGIQEHSEKISNFLFGYPLRITAIMGGAYGVLSGILTANYMRIVTWGGVCLSAFFVRPVAEGLFSVSSMLIP